MTWFIYFYTNKSTPKLTFILEKIYKCQDLPHNFV